MLHSATGRALAAAVLILIVGAVIFFAFRGYVTTIASSAGVSQATNISQAVGSTTQELQKPTYSFLFASFEETLYLLFLGAVGIVFLMRERILALLGGSRRRTLLAVAAVLLIAIAVDLFVLNGAYLPGFLHQFKYLVGYISVLAYMLLVFYLFRKSSQSPADRSLAAIAFIVISLWLLLGWVGIWYFIGSWQTPLYLTLFSFLAVGIVEYNDRSGENDINMLPYLVLLSYLLVTAYLQFNAIRYNALLSIPLAIFAAFGLFIIIERIGRIKLTQQNMQYIFAVAAVAVLIIIAWFWLRNIINTGNALPSTNFAKNWYLFDGYASLVLMLAIAAYAIGPIFTGKSTNLKMICLIAAGLAAASLHRLHDGRVLFVSPGGRDKPLLPLGHELAQGQHGRQRDGAGALARRLRRRGMGQQDQLHGQRRGRERHRIYYFARYLANTSAGLRSTSTA